MKLYIFLTILMGTITGALVNAAFNPNNEIEPVASAIMITLCFTATIACGVAVYEEYKEKL